MISWPLIQNAGSNLLNNTISLCSGETKNGEPRIVYLTEECRMLVTELRKGKQPEDFLLTRNGEPVRDFRGAWNALVIRQRDCRDCCSMIFAAAYRKRQREKFPATRRMPFSIATTS